MGKNNNSGTPDLRYRSHDTGLFCRVYVLSSVPLTDAS